MVLARVVIHVLARVLPHVLARVLPHVLARVLLHVLARVIIHVHDYYSKTCPPETTQQCIGEKGTFTLHNFTQVWLEHG